MSNVDGNCSKPPAKRGRDDEKEIHAMANKLKEQMAQQPQPTMVIPAVIIPTTEGSPMAAVSNCETKSISSCYERSLKGHFGWVKLGAEFVPYIFRQSEKYCSVRIFEMMVLENYLNCLHPDTYLGGPCADSYSLMEEEASLFNEINQVHCDEAFGSDLFTQQDLIVRLSDAISFYQFLDACCKVKKSTNVSGFRYLPWLKPVENPT